MKSKLSRVSPPVLVAAALPFILLLAPDGIPFVTANCSTTTTGNVSGPTSSCEDCNSVLPSTDWVDCLESTLTTDSGHCTMTAYVRFTIHTTDQCDVTWASRCAAPCSIGPTITGPVTNHTASKQRYCNTLNDAMSIELNALAVNCGCQNSGGNLGIFTGTGVCGS